MIEMPREPQLFEAGSLIAGRYEVVSSIGSGGMGWVLHVIDRTLDNKSVALKLLYPHLVKDEKTFARFRNELLVTRDLAHPNIVRMYDLGCTETGQYFISLEFVHGSSLKELLLGNSRKGLPFPDAVRVLHDITQGVAYAHSRGIVHRDLKPDNVLVSTLGEVKIVDFGIARSLWQGNGLTKTGGAVGTPYYMAPEQIQGEAADLRADIYALGIMAYELVVGTRPFDDDCFFKLATMHMSEPMPLHKLDEFGVAPWFKEIVERATAKNPDDRFESAEDVLDILREHVPTGRIVVRNRASGSPTGTTAIQARPASRVGLPSVHFFGWFGLISLLFIVAFAHLRSNPSWREFAGSRVLIWENSLGVKLPPLRAFVGLTLSEDMRQDLFAAIERGDKWDTMMLARGGVSLNVPNRDGELPLHVALKKSTGDAHEVVERLLLYGANPNALDARGRHPLVVAIVEGQPDLHVGTLLDFNANPVGIKDERGTPVLQLMMRRCLIDDESIKLMRRGASPDDRDAEGNTGLHVAAGLAELRETIFDAVLDQQKEIDTPNSRGETPLFIAAERGRLGRVQQLLRRGASASVRDKSGRGLLEVTPEPLRARMSSMLAGSKVNP